MGGTTREMGSSAVGWPREVRWANQWMAVGGIAVSIRGDVNFGWSERASNIWKCIRLFEFAKYEEGSELLSF